MKVLYVEDDPNDIFLFRLKARNLADDIDISSAGSANEAQQKIAAEPFDCILIDYRLENENGLELVLRLRAQGVETPIIMFTGVGDDEIADLALRRGANAYLVKDFEDKQMEQIIGLIRSFSSAERNGEEVRAEDDMSDYERAMSEAAGEGLLVHKNGIVLTVNGALERLLGTERGDIVDRSVLDFIAPDSREPVGRVLTKGQSEICEAEVICSGGERAAVEVHGQTVNIRGVDHHVIAMRRIAGQSGENR